MAKLNSKNGKTFTKVASYRVESEALNEGLPEDTHFYFKFAERSDGMILRAIASSHTMYNGKKYTNGGNYSCIGKLREGHTLLGYLNRKFGEENVTRINR